MDQGDVDARVRFGTINARVQELRCSRHSQRVRDQSVGVKREFGDIGRPRIRYAAASEALALIARVAGEQ